MCLKQCYKLVESFLKCKRFFCVMNEVLKAKNLLTRQSHKMLAADAH